MSRTRLDTAEGRRRTLPAALLQLALLLPVAVCADSRKEPDADVQSMLLRAVTVTYDLERSLLFYRDILGQEIVEDAVLSTARARDWLDVSAKAELRFVVLRGRAEYPGGPIAGGRVAFIGVREPDGSRPPPRAGRRATQGDVILPHRVRGIDAIHARLQRAGFEILFAPRVSATGLSRNMMVYDPNGHIVELFELR